MVELTTQPVEDFDVSRFGGEGFEFAGAFDVNADVVDHPAGPEQQNAVGETDGFAEVVGYEDDRPAYLRLPKLEEFSLYFDSGLRIEGGKGFVHQQDVRIQCPRSGQRDTLAHPLGELPSPQP